MTRAPSSEPSKSSKRKGARSVSTLTPNQLARKRANDREAQRAIRQRTKEHIEKLERELEDLKNQHNRDETVKDLMRRNKILEKELDILRKEFARLHTSQPYSPAAYDDNLAAPPSGVSSRASSFGAHSADYGSPVPDYASSYAPTSDSCEHSWTATLPCSVSSTVSSPTSTTNDDYGYIPASVAPMMEGMRMAPTSMPVIEGQEIEYDNVSKETVYGRSHTVPVPIPSHYHMPQQQSWPIYPPYYTAHSPGMN